MIRRRSSKTALYLAFVAGLAVTSACAASDVEDTESSEGAASEANPPSEAQLRPVAAADVPRPNTAHRWTGHTAAITLQAARAKLADALR